ncbi:MAG: DegV family protein [Clostridia bacterium]|nr:DegV family protein [Clostridia bacterium]
MKPYVLSCCSTVDLTKEHLKDRNICYACYHYSLDDKEYTDDLWQTIKANEFFDAMLSGAETKTSQINTDEFVTYFRQLLRDGNDVVHVCMSSGLSGTYNSARIAAELLQEEYPDQKIYLVDSLGASSGYGLLVDQLADLRDSGMSAQDLFNWANENKLKVHHWFFSTDLTFYIKGGRVSKVSGWFGTMLKICPLLNMDHEGKLIPRFKIRGKKQVIHAIVEKMIECAKDGKHYDGKCYISHSACYEDARAVADLIENAFPGLKDQVNIYSIGTTIGSHTGPGTVALFFWGNERNE